MPHMGYVFPAGGRQGSVVQVAIGGQYLNNPTNAYISGSGVQAAFVEYTRPLTQKEFNDLREKVRELQERRTAALRTAKSGGAGSLADRRPTWCGPRRTKS